MQYIRKYRIKGTVQGVGFRPFVFRAAKLFTLDGWVLNDNEGVVIRAQGSRKNLEEFIEYIFVNAPALADVQSIDLLEESLGTSAQRGFAIKPSQRATPSATQISPDAAVCENCLTELFDANNRRYLYPFISCTNCGPRYSITLSTPYDRVTTTMNSFEMCPTCLKEFENPHSRRFHDQPNACPKCGPSLSYLNASGQQDNNPAPLVKAVELIKSGKILGVKGLGGFHLVADPYNEVAVSSIRIRKNRPAKPFALMCANVEQVNRYVETSSEAERELNSPSRPIVILPRRSQSGLAPSIAPGSTTLGFMLAYTPLHFLLLQSFHCLLVTSANIPSEPLVYRDEEAIVHLSTLVDGFLTHNRVINTPLDDSVIQFINSGQGLRRTFIRRARGYAPNPLTSKLFKEMPPMIALGAELKNTICIAHGNTFHLSQHIGDLKTIGALYNFESIIHNLQRILEIDPTVAACDLHPHFMSSHYAQNNFEQVIKVQHHHAHLAACMVENDLAEKTVGVIFDGYGFGSDGQAWGGEFLIGDYLNVQRVGHLKPMPLPGGDKAVVQPWRIALGMLYQIYGDQISDLNLNVIHHRSQFELQTILQMLGKKINTPMTSSVGRLFDCFSALLDICPQISYEAQAAVELEQHIDNRADRLELHFDYADLDGAFVADPTPLFREVVQILSGGHNLDKGQLSFSFHNAIAEMIVQMCKKIRAEHNVSMVLLSGGVFMNRFLLESATTLLSTHGFKVYTHHKVPVNDGGLSLGQAAVAAARLGYLQT